MNTQGGFETLAGEDQPTIEIAGAPVNGVDDMQTITGDGVATAKLTFVNPLTSKLAQTPALAATASAAAIQTALRALSNMPTAGVTCTGGPLGTADVVCTFVADLSGLTVAPLVSDQAGVTVAHTTPGVVGTGRGAAKGTLLSDMSTPKLYQQAGTVQKPNWQKVGAQT